MASYPSIDIVVVSFNTREDLRACLRSIQRCAPSQLLGKTIVVDNASHDGSQAMVRQDFPAIELLALDENVGFGAANNRGMARGSAPFVLFLNSDAQLTPGAVEELLRAMETYPNCVVAGPQLEGPDGDWQASCRRVPGLWRNFWRFSGLSTRFPDTVPAWSDWLSKAEHVPGARPAMVSGACFLARRPFMESLGGFDENLFLYEEETDLAIPVRRRRLEVRYWPAARVIHRQGASVRAQGLTRASMHHLFRSKYFVFRKHRGHLYAWLLYTSDRALLGMRVLRDRLRGVDSSFAEEFAVCRQAWQDSFRTAEELRAQPSLHGG